MSSLPISVGWLLGSVLFIPVVTLYNLNCYSFIASLYPIEEFQHPPHQSCLFFSDTKIYINFRMT